MISSIFPIPAFADNYIWAIHRHDSNDVCVVDPGDAKPVRRYLESNGLRLTDILITHHHPDHVGGLLELKQAFNPRITGPESSNIKGITHFVLEKDIVEVFDSKFSVLEVPGHTLDHLAYYSADHKEPLLFCGDTLFAAGCGRLFEGTPDMMKESLDKLAALPESTLVYCTHEYTMANLKFALAVEPDNNELNTRYQEEQSKRQKGKTTLPSNLALELQTNPFLRCDHASIKNSVERYSQRQLDTRSDTFAALRLWKDNF